MSKIEIKTKDGKKSGTYEVHAAIAGAKPVDHVLHRVIVAEEANRRQGTQSARTRSEVRGGGKKPYKQKKTGNARQGSIRAPHYAHGGMALAVKPRGYDKKVNKKERRAAILGALNMKIESGDLSIADQIVFTVPKTKDAANLLKTLELADTRRLLVILHAHDQATLKSFRNLPNVVVRTAPTNAPAPASEDAQSPKAKATKDKAASAPKGRAKLGKSEGEAEALSLRGAKRRGNAEGAKTSVFSARDVLVAHKVLVTKDAMQKIEEVWAK